MADNPDNSERLTWAAFAMLVGLVVVTAMVVLSTLFIVPNNDIVTKSMIEGRILQRTIVLFLVVPTIAILCMRDKIAGEAALAALSAIAGYVLGSAAAG